MAIKRESCDVWFSKAVRFRDGRCLYTGRTDLLECCHIYGRRARIGRWDLANAVTLTHSAHRHFTENPVAFHDWLVQTLGEAHMEILRDKQNGILKTTRAVRLEIAKHYRDELRKAEGDSSYTMVSYN